MPQLPAEFAFCLVIGSATALCHQQHTCLADEKLCEPARDVTGRLSSNSRRKGWEPFAHWCGFVVDDVVDARAATLQRERSGGRCIIKMYEGPDASPVAHERKLPVSHEFELDVIRRAVKGAVA